MNRGRIDAKILTGLFFLIGFVVADEISDTQTQDNPCFGKHGVFLPSRKSCNEYLICVEGLTVINSCGDNHYDARLGICALPERAGCIISRPEPLPVIETICLGKENGTKLPMGGNSSQYFVCVQGYAQLKDCGKLIFDSDVLECVGNTRKRPCSGVRNGARVSVEHDPRKYYICMNNRAFIKSCGDLFFNAKTSSCSLESDTENEVKVQPLRPLAPAVVLSSQERPLQQIVKEPTVVAISHIPLPEDRPLLTAPKPPAFAVVLASQGNPVKDAVKEPTVVDIATIIKSKPTEVDVAPPEQDRPLEANRLALRICQGQKFGARIAIPGTCSQYYICMGNTGILKSCGQMQFHPEIAACDLASNVQCIIQQGIAVYGPKHTEMEPQSQAVDVLKICEGKSDHGLFPVPGNCSQFFYCFKNTTTLKDCGQRHFSPITMSCVDLEMSNCVDGNATAKKPLAEVAGIISCRSRDNGVLLKHPTDCRKFLLCDNHQAVEMNCPEGLHFNVNEDYCDWPELAKCS